MNNQLPKRRVAGVLCQFLGEETVVFDSQTNEAHALNPAATLIYEACDGKTSKESLIQALCRRLELSEIDAEDSIRHFLQEFSEKGLLEDDECLGQWNLTRREFVSRGVILPAVLTLAVGTQQAAASPDPCAGCDCTAAQAGGANPGVDCTTGALGTEVACGRIVAGTAVCTCEQDNLTCTTAPINGEVCSACPPPP